jgi:hypothetical protein
MGAALARARADSQGASGFGRRLTEAQAAACSPSPWLRPQPARWLKAPKPQWLLPSLCLAAESVAALRPTLPSTHLRRRTAVIWALTGIDGRQRGKRATRRTPPPTWRWAPARAVHGKASRDGETLGSMPCTTHKGQKVSAWAKGCFFVFLVFFCHGP